MSAHCRVSRAALHCSFLLASALLPQTVQAQLYSWKDAQGNVTIRNTPPPWYRESERSNGPRVQVLRGGKIIDDTAWPLERRQQGRTQSARQEAARPPPPQESARGPSTSEERANVLKLAKALEQNLTTGIAESDRLWFMKLIKEIPDITLDLGPVSAWSGEAVKKDHAPGALLQFMLSAVAFQIENPTKAKDAEAVDLGGLEGVLRSYENLVKNYPSAQTDKMDTALKLRAKRELPEFVKQLRAKSRLPLSKND